MSDTATNSKQLYEGLFLFNLNSVGVSIKDATEILERFLERADAEVVTIARWEERRLAYEISGQKRGLYMIAYFHAPGDKITGLERDVKLSEDVLRCMVLRADHMGDVEIEAAKEMQANSQAASALQADTSESAESTETATVTTAGASSEPAPEKADADAAAPAAEDATSE